MNPPERLNGEIKRRTRAVGIFPNDAAVLSPVTAVIVDTRHSDGEAGGESRRRGGQEPGRDALMPPRLEDGLRDGRAASRVPRDYGRSKDGRQPRLIQCPGLRLAAGPRTRVRLSDMSVPCPPSR